MQVSSLCDDFLDQLNMVSFLGVEDLQDRCMRLRFSLQHLNRAQGMGFLVFGTVVDRPMLVKIGITMAGGAGTVVTALIAVGTRGVGGAGSTA